jgi:acyl-CoA reductase-like NAD-dependent aldehyde dehydrogenase
MKKVTDCWLSPTFRYTHRALVFAPIATLMTYETVDEAIEIANSTRYGLGASVFGTHQDECYKVAKRLHAGMVAVNDFAVFYVCVNLLSSVLDPC